MTQNGTFYCIYMGVPQPKPLYGFSPNFQNMFTPSGYRADLSFEGYPATTVAMATLLGFSGFKVCGCSTA